MGYAGGTTADPTYHKLGDHTETVQVDYDPGKISYETLLDAFWRSHDPAAGGPIQYRSIIFYHNEAQQTAALESMAREEARIGRKILTAVIPYVEFYLAEDYHQKYYLRSNRVLFGDISGYYPDPADFLNSTAAARINGYLGGFGDEAAARAQLDEMGLGAQGRQELLETIDRGIHPVCAVP